MNLTGICISHKPQLALDKSDYIKNHHAKKGPHDPTKKQEVLFYLSNFHSLPDNKTVHSFVLIWNIAIRHDQSIWSKVSYTPSGCKIGYVNSD